MAEHKLILGGQQYLPFARSRIKALRATGLRYASREWFMPGGEFVQVRIEDEQEFIRLGGGGALLAMDSGLIDLQAIGENAAARYANGVRQDTSSTAAYLAGFTQGSVGDVWKNWLSKPATVPNGELIGTVEVPKFAGHIKSLSTAPSFEAARKPVAPATNPPTWIFSPDDDTLYAKKLMASSCAASIFTGRCRLYVQALYGRPLYRYSNDASTSPQASAIGGPSLASTEPPSLSLPPYVHAGDTVSYPPVTINTSTGVHFDPTTGRHWLLKVDGPGLTIYPLVSSSVGESLRRYLKGAAVGKGAALSAADQEKLEAYVLAYCLPDVKNAVSLSPGAGDGDYSMGYGWHWNWSGTVADIVTTSEFDQGVSSEFPAGSTAMVSTHHRMTVALVGDVWSATKSVVEDQKQWAVNRLFWCIAEPQWAGRSTLKSTPQHSKLFDCDAPFYAFYQRDELVVCRIAVKSVPAGANVRTFSTNFCTPDYGSTVAEFTGGMLDGFCEDAAASSPYFSASISAGAASIADLILGKTTTFSRWDVFGKTEIIPPSRVVGNDQGVASGTSVTLSFGYDAPYGTLDHVTVTGPGTLSSAAPPTVQFTREFSTGEDDESSTLTVVVPFDDAQAIFVDGAKFTTHTSTGQQVSVRNSQAFVSAEFWIPQGGATQTFRSYLTGGTAGGIVSSSTPADSSTSTTTDVQNLMCVAGAVPATMGELASFHNDQDYASVSYSVLSGVSSAAPVALSPGNAIPPVGAVGPVPQFPALVGWV